MPTSNTRAFGKVSTRPRRVTAPVPDNVVVAPTPAPVAAAPAPPAAVFEPHGGRAPLQPPVELEAPELVRSVSELAIEAPSEPTAPAFPPFAACYNEALGDMPPSILRALQDRLERKQYDLGVPDEAVHEAIAKTRSSYQKKREAGRLRSARVRAEKKAQKSNLLAEAEPEADPAE